MNDTARLRLRLRLRVEALDWVHAAIVEVRNLPSLKCSMIDHIGPSDCIQYLSSSNDTARCGVLSVCSGDDDENGFT
jgi:hypothetical protein